MQLAWLSLAIITTVGYHLVMKVTPAAVNPFLSLAATYSLGAAVFFACFALAPDGPTLRESLKPLNWTALGLTLMVVGLDVGFLMLYRSGFDVSLGQIVTQSGAALILWSRASPCSGRRSRPRIFAGIALCVLASG